MNEDKRLRPKTAQYNRTCGLASHSELKSNHQREKAIVKRFFSVLLVLVLLAVLLPGCSNQTVVIPSLVQQAEEAKQEEQARIAEVKLTQREILEKMYRNGLMDEDFTEIKQRLDKEYETWLEQELKPLIKDPFFVKCDVGYFNSSLKEARAGNWEIDKILTDPKNNIRDGRIQIYVFEDKEMYTPKNKKIYEEHNKVLSKYIFNYEVLAQVEPLSWMTYVCDFNALESYTLNDFKDSEEMLCGLKDQIFDYDCWSFDVDMLMIPAMKSLEKKYGEPFVNVWGYSHLGGKGELSCAPLSNPKRMFQKQFMQGEPHVVNDKYLTVLAQDYMGREIEAILQEEGLGDIVAQVVIPHCIKDEDSDQTPCQTAQIKTREDRIKFLNEVYEGSYDINLMYLKKEADGIDYQKLKKAIGRVQGLITSDAKKAGVGGDMRTPVFVHFYNVTDEDKTVVLKLFQRDRLTEGYYREAVNPSNVISQMEFTRVETDGFHYLDVFGEKLDSVIKIHGVAGDISTDEFTTRYLKNITN